MSADTFSPEEIPAYRYWELRPYPEPRGATEEKDPPRCVVSHPDAGGPCDRPAVGEVWSLAFCEVHGREAEYAAMQEALENADHELMVLTNSERERFNRNKNVLAALERATVPGLEGFRYNGEEHDRLMREAYPPGQSRVHPDTAIFDYDHHYAGDGPVDWWTETREMVARFMREASAGGLSVLVDELELIREQATAQQVIADELFERRYVEPKRAELAREGAAMCSDGPAGHPELWEGVLVLPESKGPDKDYLMWQEAEGFFDHLCETHGDHKNEAVVTALADAYTRCIEERRRAMDLLVLHERWSKRRIGGVEEPEPAIIPE